MAAAGRRAPLRRAPAPAGGQRRPEAATGRDGGAEFVLGDVVDQFDRGGLLPVPAEEGRGRDLPAVAHHGEVLRVRAVREELALPLPDPQGDIAEGLGHFGPVAGEELALRAGHRLVRALLDQRPALRGHRGTDGVEGLGHVGAEGEADGALGPARALGIGQPFEASLVVAGAVGPEAEGRDGGGEAGEAPADEGEVLHAGRDVPVPVLVGDHEVLLHPVDGRRLVAAPALVVAQGLPLVALRDRGIVIEGRGAALPLGGHPVHQGGVLRREVGHLPSGARGLGLADQPVIVDRVEEVAEPIGRGEPPAHEAAEASVGLQHRDVVEAVAPGGEQEDQGLDLLRLGVPALPLAEVDVLGDRLVRPEGAHRLQDQGQSGPAGHRVGPLDHLDCVREEPLAHRGGRPAGRAFSKAGLTSVNSSPSAQRRGCAAIHASTVARSPRRT